MDKQNYSPHGVYELRDAILTKSITTFLRLVYVEMTKMLQPASSRPAGLQRLIKAFAYSAAGLRACWENEAAFRQEAAFAVFMIPGAFWLGTSAVQRILLVSSVVLVLIVELLNTAIEAVVDRLGTDPHSLSGLAKDLGSAAVLLSLAAVWLTWGLIAWERFG